MFIEYNKNPLNNYTDDCVIRAISAEMDRDWDDVWLDIMVLTFQKKCMMSSNNIWQEYLHNNGYVRYNIPDTCPNCYTIKQFAEDFQNLLPQLLISTIM